MRRPGVGSARRSGWRGIGGALPPSLYLGAGGTFTRSTEGSYLVGAPTDGSTAFLAWAAINARRIGVLGLLLEGSRTNYMIQSRDPATSWTAGTATLTSNQNGGPDGATLADRFAATSAQFSNYEHTKSPASSIFAVSSWARAVSGTASWQMLAMDGNALMGAGSAYVTSIGTTWTRGQGRSPTAPGTGGGIMPVEGRDRTAIGGQVATAQDVYIDLPQVEVGYWASSPIRTVATSVTRGADVLSYATGEYPASILDAGFRVVVLPGMTSTELIASTLDMRIVQVGANDYLRLRRNGAAADIDLVCGGVIKGTLAVTFTSRDQALTITAQPTLGKLTVSGATTGDGTNTVAGAAWAAASTLYVGADNAGTNPYFGHIGSARLVLL